MAALPVNNLAAQSWAATIPMDVFVRMADVANEARQGISQDEITQRPLDANHSYKLARYVLRAMVDAALKVAARDQTTDPNVLESLGRFHSDLGGQPIFALQPFVLSIREQDRMALHIARMDNFEVLTIPNKTKLWVIDGQHRVHAIRALADFFSEVQANNHYPAVKIGRDGEYHLYADSTTARTEPDGRAWRLVEYQFSQCDVGANIFTTLDIRQERQLFHDLNNLGKSVESGLAFAFDESNPINLWIKRFLIPKILGSNRIANRDAKNWEEDEGKFVRKDVVAVNAFLFLRKTSVRSAEPKDVNETSTKLAARFWSQIMAVDSMGQPGAKKTVILAQPVVQKALALLVNEYGLRGKKSRKRRDPVEDQKVLDQILANIPRIDWRHQNPLWHAWLESDPERKFPGIAPYLPVDRAKAKGEFATIDAHRVRFGVKHNEIAPALSNLIRFAMKLPAKGARRSKRHRKV
jgi:hypothetical protein